MTWEESPGVPLSIVKMVDSSSIEVADASRKVRKTAAIPMLGTKTMNRMQVVLSTAHKLGHQNYIKCPSRGLDGRGSGDVAWQREKMLLM